MNGGQPGTRRSFVVQIYADGTTTVENLRTRERVPIAISALGSRNEAWLADDGHPPDRESESRADEASGEQ
jgi:hypothetical protein